MAPDGVGEVRHGVSPVGHVRRERCVDTPHVVGGRSFQAGERGPLLYQRRRDSYLGGLLPSLCSRDGQGKDLGLRGCGGDPHAARWLAIRIAAYISWSTAT